MPGQSYGGAIADILYGNVSENEFLVHFSICKRSFCQDRLGTNIGETQEQSRFLFFQVNPSGKLPVTLPNHDNETAFSAAQWPGLPGPPPPPGAGGTPPPQITEANYTEVCVLKTRPFPSNDLSL
jgi:hypothetical protein